MSPDEPIKGLLVDLDGVIYVGDQLITGANEALNKIRELGIPIKFITNTTTRSPDKLASLGIDADRGEIFTAVNATLDFLSANGAQSCHLLLRESIKPLFKEFPIDDHKPDYVIIGASWDYQSLNSVFNMLMRRSRLVCIHRNKFWQGEEGLRMDIGAFVAALEYVSGKEALVIGKPSKAFFRQAIEALGVRQSRVAIVGDDIDSDICGGQNSGIRGILVKTGKYRENYTAQSSIEPDFTVDSIREIPQLLRSLNAN